MDIGRTIGRQLKTVAGPTLGLGLSVYAAYHLVEGDRGLIAMGRLTQQITRQADVATTIRSERVAEQHRVSMLQPEHLDPDLLDEQARSALNLAAPGEVILLDGQEQSK